MTDRAAIEVETLLKVVLVLVIAYLVLGILNQILRFVLGPLIHVIGIAIVVLIVLWLLDRI